MKTTPVTREVLYKQVWEKPMLIVAQEYSVSSSYLARVCTRMNIPRPPRGYWAKYEVGKVGKQPPLPEAKPEDELAWVREGDRIEYIPVPLPTPPKKIDHKSIKAKKRLSQHRLLRGARGLFLTGRETEHHYLKPNKKLLVDLIVSKSGLDIALNITNQLFLTFEDAGYRVAISPNHQDFRRHDIDERETPSKNHRLINHWHPMRPTVVYIDTVAIGLTVYEISKSVEMLYVKGDYIPLTELTNQQKILHKMEHSWTTHNDQATGQFCLQAYSPYPATSWMKQWKLPKRKNLRKLFVEIADELSQEATKVAELVAEAERQAEIQRQQWEIEQLERERKARAERREKAIKLSLEDLNSVISNWGQVKQIEAFFNEVEQHSQQATPEEQTIINDRLEQARDLIGNTDALEHFKAWKAPKEQLKGIIKESHSWYFHRWRKRGRR